MVLRHDIVCCALIMHTLIKSVICALKQISSNFNEFKAHINVTEMLEHST